MDKNKIDGEEDLAQVTKQVIKLEADFEKLMLKYRTKMPPYIFITAILKNLTEVTFACAPNPRNAFKLLFHGISDGLDMCESCDCEVNHEKA